MRKNGDRLIGIPVLDTPKRRANFDILMEFFDSSVIRNAIESNGSVLDIDIRTRLRHIKSVLDASKMIEENPRLLLSNLDTVVMPAYKSLRRLFGDCVNVDSLLLKHPKVLTALAPEESAVLISLRTVLDTEELERLSVHWSRPVSLLVISNVKLDIDTPRVPSAIGYTLV
eukprot:CFRG5567T1